MSQYLLSTYATGEHQDPPPEASPPSPDDMQEMMGRILELEQEMVDTGTFVFGGHLHGRDAVTVVRATEADVVMTDGPFVESKEHIAGFYIINAADLDEALSWAAKVTACVGAPIEVWPFAATGRVADHMPQP